MASGLPFSRYTLGLHMLTDVSCVYVCFCYLLALLLCVRKYIPIGGDQWKKVAEEFGKLSKEHERDETSLKKKFMNLANSKAPTGDPNCPVDVKEAKFLYRLIVDKAGVIEVGGVSDDEQVLDPVYSCTESDSHRLTFVVVFYGL
jgi:hypothetical protein